MKEPVNILFIMEIREDVKQHLARELADSVVVLVFPEDLSDERLLELAPVADVMVGWNPTKEMLFAAGKLKLFIVPWAGIQNTIKTLREANEECPIPLVNSHDNAYATAQHGVALLLSLVSKVVVHHNWMVQGKWRQQDEGGATSITLRNRNIGLLGYGHVNRQLHRFLSSFDLEFSVLRRNWDSPTVELPTHVERFTPDEMSGFLTAIDTLIIAVPETEETKGLIGKEELELLGTDGLLVNISRGKVVDQDALYGALKDRTIAGAAVDVWYDYRPEADEQGRKYPYRHPFHELENLVMSPHRSASPYDSLEKWTTNIENIKRVAEGRSDYINVVDLERGY